MTSKRIKRGQIVLKGWGLCSEMGTNSPAAVGRVVLDVEALPSSRACRTGGMLSSPPGRSSIRTLCGNTFSHTEVQVLDVF